MPVSIYLRPLVGAGLRFAGTLASRLAASRFNHKRPKEHAEHFHNDNPLKRYSLGTKNKNLKLNPDGSLTLYAGAKSPGKDWENNWLPAPNGTFSLYIRAYWPDEATIDGSWQPPAIEKVK